MDSLRRVFFGLDLGAMRDASMILAWSSGVSYHDGRPETGNDDT